MDSKRLKPIRMIITMTMGAIIGWSVAKGNTAGVLVAIVVGTALLYLLRSKVTQVVEDERTYVISGKASSITLRVVSFVAASIGAVLIALSKGGLTDFEQAGFTLAFTGCALLVLYIIFYGYYGKEYGD